MSIWTPPYLGDFTTANTIYLYFNTNTNANPTVPVTITGFTTADIEIYKNGSATQRTSDSGFALLDSDGIDFDGQVGVHGCSIDLSDNSHAGFYAVGSEYVIVIQAITVAATTVQYPAATFSIERTGCTLALVKLLSTPDSIDVTITGS
jgi:hypothetical protein